MLLFHGLFYISLTTAITTIIAGGWGISAAVVKFSLGKAFDNAPVKGWHSRFI